MSFPDHRIEPSLVAGSLPRRGLLVFSLIVTGLMLLGLRSPRVAAGSRDCGADQYDWPAYGGNPEDNHFSPLDQINRRNVGQLQVAWTFDTSEQGGLETTPLVIDGVLYAYTPSQRIFALDAATGKRLWVFDSGVKSTQPNRGLAYWSDGKTARLLAGVMNYVYALDARTGAPIPDFGRQGRIDLRENLRGDPAAQIVYLTSPGVIYKDLLIVGGRNLETQPNSPGYIRAYDVRSGRLRWTFHTIPEPGEFGYETWPQSAWKSSGGANNWAGMAVDPVRGLVYVPTGSASFDFYGADRIGDDLFANSLIALNAKTGDRVWHFQAVRHDLWDRDFPAPPVLATLHHDRQTIDAVVATTKNGFVYVFDRVTGKPLFPIEYRAYPGSTVPGERAAPQQPLPAKPAPFARQKLTEDLLTNRTPAAHEAVRKRFRTLRSEGQFVPPSVGLDTVVFPGFDGGAEWGGPALDPQAGVLYVNANEMAWTARLAKNGPVMTGESLYLNRCAFCHGDDRAGSPPFPSLRGLRNGFDQQQARQIIRAGRGRMPGFANLSDPELHALLTYLLTGQKLKLPGAPKPLLKYRFTGYHKFLDPDGYPAITPPWGTLSAINLNTGEYVWRISLGEYPELAAQGLVNTGSENYGGPIVTAGGLVFIAATNFDRKFRAFDKDNGKLLWSTTLPYAGNATPASYEVNGRQYVVIAAGGGKDVRSPSGGVYVAFALPEEKSAQQPAARELAKGACVPRP